MFSDWLVCAQGLVGFPDQEFVGFMLSCSGLECVLLALISGPKCVSFTGSGFRIRVHFFGWPFTVHVGLHKVINLFFP